MSQPADPEARPGVRNSLAAFRYRNFALFWTGALISNTGVWVQNITIPFVVFQLTDSPAWVGFAAFTQPRRLAHRGTGRLAGRSAPAAYDLLLTQGAHGRGRASCSGLLLRGGRSPWSSWRSVSCLG